MRLHRIVDYLCKPLTRLPRLFDPTPLKRSGAESLYHAKWAKAASERASSLILGGKALLQSRAARGQPPYLSTTSAIGEDRSGS